MFNKKKCKRCNTKIKNSYDFCPQCGLNFKGTGEDYGLLGTNDFIQPSIDDLQLPFGFNKLFKSLFKELNNQLGELDKATQNPKKQMRGNGISINFSSGLGQKPQIKVQELSEKQKQIKSKKHVNKISEVNLKKFSKLPRKEATTKVRRFDNKIIYEIKMPEVKSLENVFINQLENSIEIKALGKKQVYVKILPFNFPIIDYFLEKGKLILELQDKKE